MSGSSARISAAEGKRLGLPEDFKWWSALPFAGVNQEDARTSMEDAEFFWLENYLPIGKGLLRTLWNNGAALYTPPTGKTIVWFSWFNIGSTQYCAVFLSDGTAVQVSTSGATVAISSTASTFYTGSQLPFACQSGEQYLLISNNIAFNNYWIWDGTILYFAGTLGPVSTITDAGTGYTSAPTVTFFGGAGSGATATATVTNGAVTAVTITNPGSGYNPGDTVQIAFSGGGSTNSAVLTAVLAAGVVATLEITAGGTGYTTAPTVGFTGGGGGSGAAAIATVTAGVVTALTITNQGSGYTSTPTVTFTGGAGSGAAAVAILSAGVVASVTVVNGGSGFTGTPMLSFTGGGGSGAAATATITSGAISSVTVTNGGSAYTAAPTVVVATGFNTAASGSNTPAPFGVSGTTIENFQSRVWIANPYQTGPMAVGGVFSVSAPESITDFATSDGGLVFTNSDRYLRAQYVSMHQLNGYLYPIGDSSVSVISNVQTSGTPTSTTFNYFNTSAQIGAAWRDTVQDLNQSVLFANGNGIVGLYGGAIRKLSNKLNNVFANAVFPPASGALTPSGAVCNLYTIPVYLLLMTVTDPLANTPRNVMVGWDEKNWFIASQTTALKFIATQEVDSVLNAWGTDGNGLYQLFTTPSASLTKTIATKAFASDRAFIIKQPLACYLRATDVSTGQAGISMNITLNGFGIAQQIGLYGTELASQSYPVPLQPYFLAPFGTQPVWAAASSAVPGSALAMTITSTSADFTISEISLAYRDEASVFG